VENTSRRKRRARKTQKTMLKRLRLKDVMRWMWGKRKEKMAKVEVMLISQNDTAGKAVTYVKVP